MTESNERVSVVIPVYNGAKYVVDAVRSALDQDLAPHEVVVVDDGSTDETLHVLGEFGSRIKVLAQRNQGVSVARNNGAAAVTGEFLAFLDADDVWLTPKLARQVAVFRDRPDVAMTYTGLTVVDEQLQPLGAMSAPRGADALRNSLLLEPPVVSVAQTAVLRTSVFHAVGGFDPDLTTSADTDLACRVAVRHAVEGVDEPLVLYRQHGAQMHLNADAMLRDMSLVFDRMFSDPALPSDVASLRGRAIANLHTTVAAAAVKDGRSREGLRHLAFALRAQPVRTLRLVASLAARRAADLVARRTT